MSSSPVLNRAALIMRQVSENRPADQVLRDVMAAHREWSPVEKRELSRAIFSSLRWFAWLDHKAPYQAQVERALELQARFEREPSSIKDEALAARAVPGWIASELELAPAWLRQLQREPALWLRPRAGHQHEVERSLGDCETVRVERQGAGFAFLDGSVPPHRPGANGAWPDDCHLGAIRYAGSHDLFHTPAFHHGAFEIQDLASQIVGRFCAPQAGQTWWDACAGEGGKTLHLSDLMGGGGLIWASDRSKRRLEVLKRRAARAQVFNYRAELWDGGHQLPTKTRFDGVLVDAPCSGVGTWQRNPHARWTTTPADVAELAEVQRSLLTHVAPSVKPGGRLVYSVCTLTRSETAAVADAFSAEHPEFEPMFRGAVLPQALECNGMYLAAWRRK